MRGLFEFEIEGQTRGFLFDFMAFGLLEEKLDLPLDEIIARLQPKKGEEKPKKQINFILDVFYCGAVNYANYKDLPVNFKIRDVSNWVSEIGFSKAGEMITSALSAFVPKN